MILMIRIFYNSSEVLIQEDKTAPSAFVAKIKKWQIKEI
jgi:hypothetical protein